MSDNPRCLYNNSFTGFLGETEMSILGELVDHYHGEARTSSIEAWKGEISIMQEVISRFGENEGRVIFEYDIPRLGKRIDVVLLFKGIIFCIEFKVRNNQELNVADVDQVLDYALDLKNFHKYSQDKLIVPILIAPNYERASTVIQMSVYDDRVVNPLVTGKEHINDIIKAVLDRFPNETPVDHNWLISPYAPTPTIIEAARSLYENHSVEDITRHEADKVYTDRTIDYILQVIKKSKAEQRKSICFVTGVPGAGKTLVGLDVAIKQTYQGNKEPVEDEGAVYLSGNGPLVAVLTEALAQDNYKKSRENNEPKKLTDSRREVSKSIQMIHRYRDNMLAKIKNPVENGVLEIDPEKAVKLEKAGFGEVEHVAIFEAQRSWTHKRLADYLKRGGTYGNKLKVPNFPMSEAAFLIWSLDQREDWATIVCLVGGGQEINTGEAGISEWIAALNQKFPQWDVYISPKLTDAEYAEGKVNELLKDKSNVTFAESLHLAVSLRSYRAEKLSAFVHALLTFDAAAATIYAEIKDNYPIVLTRDMAKARKWLHEKVRGSERTGVLVTKEAARFKPLAIHILPSGDENAVHWFLEDKTDTRSSNYLEDAATEIQVQGLELDYTCLLWDADMRYEDGKWGFYTFNGKTDWNEVIGDSESKQDRLKYMLNAYRVLLTRARAGMVICVPEGNPNRTQTGFWEDSTRLPQYYDGTYQYLKNIGIEEI